MMQLRDWIVGAIGVVVGAFGLLSLIGLLPFELSRTALVWISGIATLILLYAAIVEITNSNVVGTASLIVFFISSIVTLFPILYSFGWVGGWGEFKWLGETAYKLILIVQGFFLMIATFAMEL